MRLHPSMVPPSRQHANAPTPPSVTVHLSFLSPSCLITSSFFLLSLSFLVGICSTVTVYVGECVCFKNSAEPQQASREASRRQHGQRAQPTRRRESLCSLTTSLIAWSCQDVRYLHRRGGTNFRFAHRSCVP
jgi:hypothetical protein